MYHTTLLRYYDKQNKNHKKGGDVYYVFGLLCCTLDNIEEIYGEVKLQFSVSNLFSFFLNFFAHWCLRKSDPRELVLHTVIICHVVVGNWTRALWKNSTVRS